MLRVRPLRKKKRKVNEKFQEGLHLVPLYVTVNMHHVKVIFSIWFIDFLYTLVCVHAQSCLTLCKPMGLNTACQAPLSMGFSRQEDWSHHFLFQGIFLTQGSNPCVMHLPALARKVLYNCVTWEAQTLSKSILLKAPSTLNSKTRSLVITYTFTELTDN